MLSFMVFIRTSFTGIVMGFCDFNGEVVIEIKGLKNALRSLFLEKD